MARLSRTCRCLAVLVALNPGREAPAGEWRFSAREIRDSGVCRDLRFVEADSALELARGELISDDGPAAGYSYRPNEERLSESLRIRKRLVIGDPRTDAVSLLVGPGGTLKAAIHGQAVELLTAKKAGNYWQAYAIPPALLNSPTIDVELWGTGKVWIARDDEFPSGASEGITPPNRSAKSADGGANWTHEKLGTKGDVDGEYCVRLFLDRYRKTGWARLPVIDLGAVPDRPISAALESPVGPLRIGFDADVGDAGRIVFRARSGSTPFPDAKNWTEWTPCDPNSMELESTPGRFLQLEASFETSDRKRSPRLRAIEIRSPVATTPAWVSRWRLREQNNPDVVRTSIDFRYEPFHHPRLRQLRQKFALDDVVQGAASEFEQITRLAAWASRQWQSGHLGKVYPAWDALEILKPYDDGKPVGGFCQQYNLVFLQACEAFGIPGRCVSIGSGDHGIAIRSGHEVVELWSNDHRKWVYVDGNAAWWFRDKTTGVPLSLRELRSRQLLAFAGKPFDEVELVPVAKGQYTWKGLADFPAFAELRMIPRSNFLEQKTPLPLNQGMRGWFWTGHEVWTDADYPASLLYGNRIEHPSAWDWTLNQAKILLAATREEDRVAVHLDSQTPGFETYLAAIDDGEWREVNSGFTWRLRSGDNKLAVRPRNQAGRLGIISHLVLSDRQPPTSK